MKSIQITSPGEIKTIDIPKPQPGDGEVLIKTKYIGFCGSDLSSFSGRNPLVNYPVIPGHEIAGVIEDKGSKVPAKIEAGMTATLVPYTSCGKCPSCRRGRENACQYNQTLGVQRNGAMSEYIVCPWEKIIPVKELSLKELALVEPLTVGFHSVNRGRVQKGETVVVLGCGIIGLGALISSVNKGAITIAVDVDDKKLFLAEKLGASFTINAGRDAIVDKILEYTGQEGADLLIEAAGQEATYLAAIEGAAFTGRVVCIGYAAKDIAFATKLFVQKELDIMGSRNATQEDFSEVISYLQKGKLPVSNLISKVVSPGEAINAMEEWVKNPGDIFKILVEFD